ncbi:oligosaccharide flippase family protein [Hyunsoonleella aestuarii]|uniref:O-antigen translocase n=1 Tax=Hyunsoonleella aestuarii TaxID=912802 RepID=A0ABP8E7U1_9FLAO|nr:oligosaccharide flippase family protein [Hyunsoonleella aestuarii]
MNQKSFHKVIFKNTRLFGASQIVTMMARLFSNKIAAIFLGPTGIGIIGLLGNILGLIYSITNLGIASSSVREIALEDQESNKLKSGRTLQIVYKWTFATGILGLVAIVVFSKQITQIIFDDYSKQWWIIALGAYFIFTSVANIRLAVLQAKKSINLIVKYNIVNAILSSVITVVGYYYFGLEAIIPVIITTALFALLLSLYFTRHVEVLRKPISIKHVFKEGLPLVKLGLLLSVSAIFGQLCFYIIRWYLKTYYSFEVLGVYQVSNTILVGYLGMVFATMSNDFYPRLCNYENNKTYFDDLINDQTEFALLIVVPAVMLLYLVAPFLIGLLYTAEFLSVLSILKVGLFGIILKAIVWPIGFISLIKGHKRLFLTQNLLGDAVNVVASLVLFYYLGLLGLGIAMVIMFLVSGVYNYYVARVYYNFKFRKKTLRIIIISILLSLGAMLAILWTDFKNFNYLIIILFIISVSYSFISLKKSLLQ